MRSARCSSTARARRSTRCDPANARPCASCAPDPGGSRRVERRPGGVAGHVIAALVASRQPERLQRTVQSSRSDVARYRARRALERLREHVRLARAYEASAPRPDLGDFVAGLTLAASDSRDQSEAASVMTIHRAKGLEFDHVWLAGLEEGLLPTVAPCARAASPRNAAWPTSPSRAPSARCTSAGRASAADARASRRATWPTSVARPPMSTYHAPLRTKMVQKGSRCPARHAASPRPRRCAALAAAARRHAGAPGPLADERGQSANTVAADSSRRGCDSSAIR